MLKNLSTKNKILIIATLIVLLIAVPLTIIQSLKQQQTKQRASSDSYGFSIMLTPSSLTKNIGEDIDVGIHLLNSQQKEVSAVDINYGDYYSNMFESVVFQNSGAFYEIINSNGRYVGIITPETQRNNADIDLGTLKFIKTKEIGTVNLSLYNIRINVSGIRDAIVFENIKGQYVIEAIKSSSPVNGNTPAPSFTPTLIPTIVPTATSTPVGSSSDASYNACVALCNRYNFAATDFETSLDIDTCIQGCSH